MRSVFGGGHSAENVENAVFSVEKHHSMAPNSARLSSGRRFKQASNTMLTCSNHLIAAPNWTVPGRDGQARRITRSSTG